MFYKALAVVFGIVLMLASCTKDRSIILPPAATPGGNQPTPPGGTVTLKALVLNELMASNSATLQNPNQPGAYPDWFEIYNPNDKAIDLGGMYVTDDLSDFKKYRIPKGQSLTLIPPKSYLVLFADDSIRQSALHVAFKLSSTGEMLGLADTSGNPVDSLRFGAQTVDVSYGRLPDATGVFQLLTAPSPGSRNQ